MSKKRRSLLINSNQTFLPWHERKQVDLVFVPRYLTAFSLLLKPKKQTVIRDGKTLEKFVPKHEMSNGQFSLKFLGDEDFGTPFGRDRIFLAHVFSQAIKNKSKIIYYHSIRSLLIQLGVRPQDISGEYRRRLKETILRVMNTVIQFRKNSEILIGHRNESIFRTVTGPLNLKDNGDEEGPYFFELSDDIYQDLIEHAVPCDIQVLHVLDDNFGAMDLYAWWNWRNYRMNKDKDFIFDRPLREFQTHLVGAVDIDKYAQQIKKRIIQVNTALSIVYGADVTTKMEVRKKRLYFEYTPPLIEEEKKVSSIQNSNKANQSIEASDQIALELNNQVQQLNSIETTPIVAYKPNLRRSHHVNHSDLNMSDEEIQKERQRQLAEFAKLKL